MNTFHWPRWRLATRFTLVVVALLLPLQLIILAAYGESLQERRRTELEDAVVIGQTVAAFVLAFVRDLESTALAATLALGPRDAPVDQSILGPYLHALVAEYGVLRALFLTDLQGVVIASDSGAGVGTDVSGRPYLRALQAGAEKVWSGALTGIESGEITVAFGRAIRGPDGSARAYFIAAFYPERLVERLPVDLPQDVRVSILDEQGIALFVADRPNLPAADRDVSRMPGVARALRGELVRLMDSPGLFGNERSFGALVPIPHVGWVVAFTRPQEPLERALLARFVRDAAAITAVTLLGGGLLAVFAYRLTRPLGVLVGTAAAVARGERPVVPDLHGDPDVTQLAAGMQAMSAAVAEREDDLRAAQQRSAFLAEAGNVLASSLDYQTTLQSVANLAVPRLADWCTVNFVDPDGQIRRVAAAHVDPYKAELLREMPARYPPDPSGPYGLAKVLRTGQPQLYPDIPDDFLREYTPDAGHQQMLARLGFSSYMSVPLVVRGQTSGAISFVSAGPGRRFGAEDVELAEQLASRAALAIDNARLYQEVQQAIHFRDDFLTTVSHDVRTPLSTIKGYAQLLLRQPEQVGAADVSKTTRMLQTIDVNAAKIARLISQLLDLSRLDTGQPLPLERRPTDLVALARRVAAENERGAEGYRVQVAAAVSGLVGEWDATRLERVLDNLIGNAVKYSPEGSEVSVSVAREGDWAVLTVRDQGVGIPEADLPRVFERFYRASNVADRVSGTGIGLAATRQIVEQHGGSVTLDSQEGAGTTATARLPLALAEQRELETRSS